jgi:DNA repair protein RecO (recombination protein O)
LTSEVSYPRAVALGHVAELLDELSPDREANDAVFRLALSVLSQLTTSEFWLPITYFDLWMARLMGYLPDISECLACGRSLNGSRAYFHALADGLMCPEHKRLASSEISAESRKLAGQMLTAPLSKLRTSALPDSTGGDLRKFLLQTLERHIEKKLVTRSMLERVSG